MKRVRRLLLAGGGHAHVEVLRRFGLQPEPDVEIVLVSPAPATPYSGMLPGLVAGHYRHADCHIDLPALCRVAGARFLQDAVTGLHDGAHGVLLASGGALEADLLSLDVGSTPPRGRIRGADTVGTGVKPVDAFLAELERRLSRPPALPARVLVVGAGAGGVEIALALRHRLDQAVASRRWQVSLVSGGPVLLPGHGQAVRLLRPHRFHCGTAFAKFADSRNPPLGPMQNGVAGQPHNSHPPNSGGLSNPGTSSNRG